MEPTICVMRTHALAGARLSVAAWVWGRWVVSPMRGGTLAFCDTTQIAIYFELR